MSTKGYFNAEEIPVCQGERAKIARWVISQRQVYPPKSSSSGQLLEHMFRDVVDSHEGTVLRGASFVESHIDGLFAKKHISECEVTLVHDLDDSIHFILLHKI
ncbi:hypothetical protein FOA43_003228 [Brettanomyces nanus]|uniref:Uncharacterized protein n=1 Tax=Eeniella nana TaxID=13502 RepID=A0A875S691_EENNA|nr:uncharacterized protein FOA43_003228 [Brettanomyces nanus]QPG75845.1 hypothetical protein FOA43_003228 [Brettanomyces nanus]